MMSWKVCANSKLYNIESHKKTFVAQLSNVEDDGEEKHRSETRITKKFDARKERIETGAVVKSRKGLSGVERGPRECNQWKSKGQCSKGGSCSFRHDEN